MTYIRAIQKNTRVEIEHLSKVISNLQKMNNILPNIGEKIQVYHYDNCYVVTDIIFTDISMGDVTIIYTLEVVK